MKKTFLTPLLAATISFAGCGSKDGIPQQKIGDVTYEIIRKNVVGVTQKHDDVSAFLDNGDAHGTNGETRQSVYFLTEGAVITEFHTDAESGNTNVNPRPIKQMLDFELEEFKVAKQFHDGQMGKKPVTPAVK